MGSSSKNRGGGMPQRPAGPTKSVTGPGANGKPQTNKYYENASMVPAEGGLVKPDALPGGIPGGIGLNFVKPQRDQLAGMMSGGPVNPIGPTTHVSYDRNGQRVLSDPFWQDPYKIRNGGGGDRGGSHAGFSGTMGAGGFSGRGGGGHGNVGGGLY